MKNFRRQLKKRSRAQTFDELETAFYDLVKNHNSLVKKCTRMQRDIYALEGNQPRYYN